MPRIVYACNKCNLLYDNLKLAEECELSHELEEVECCYSCAHVIADYDEEYSCNVFMSKTPIKLHNKCLKYIRDERAFSKKKEEIK